VLLVPRVALLFLAENPERFASRLASAHAARRAAEQQLLYNLIVDCMPPDSSSFGDDTFATVFAKSKGKTSFGGLTHPLVQELRREVDLAHARAQNKVCNKHTLASVPHTYFFPVA
jgi:hypothetical protein